MITCKDCLVEGVLTVRPAPNPGPRCATHHRAARKARAAAAHDRRVSVVYGLAAGDYQRLYDLQGGVCAGCRRATGRARRLAVDHDHVTGRVRGLLCSPCNRLLGHVRDDVGTLMRIVQYLLDPPAGRLG